MRITIDFFKKMIDGGAKAVDVESKYINDLNVFPVPDGDTGTNMKTTINGAVEEISHKDFDDFAEFAKVFSRSLLMNARGNSGVIFSQIMNGFCSNFTKEQETLEVNDFVTAFLAAKKRAYAAVSNPIEGTILTVIREISEEIEKNKAKYKNPEDLFNDVVLYGDEALNKTPELLEELAHVGVVDSGGYGLMSFFKGMNAVLVNNLNEYLKEIENDDKVAFQFDKEHALIFDNLKDELGFGYCSEIIMTVGAQINPNEQVKKLKFNPKKFLKEIESIGNSVVFVNNDNIVKVHVHTMYPFRLLEIAQQYGEFDKIKIENMTNQFLENKEGRAVDLDDKKFLAGTAIIATVPTKEIAKIYADDYNVKFTIVTENKNAPSIQDFVNKIYEAGYKNAFIVTDDSNLVLAASEATKVVEPHVHAEVIPARNVFESLSAITVFDEDANFKQNYKDMSKTLKRTLSALISTSIKDVKYSHINVNKDDKIGIIDKKIVASSTNIDQTLDRTLDELMKKAKDVDICYLIYGKNISLATIQKFEKYASERYGLFCEVQSGNQELYDVYLGLQ